MPMKKIHVEFELDPELFMKMLQHGSSSMKISVFGDEKRAKLPKEEAKLLNGPNKSVNRGLVKGGAKKIIMDYAKVHKDGFSPAAVREPVMEAGYAKNTTSPQLMALMQEGFLKRKNGSYFPTDKGMTYGQES